MRRILLFAIAVATLLTTRAEAWETSFDDNGAWFEGWLVSPDQTLFLWCGGPTPGGPGLPPTDEPMLTDPGTVDLAIRHPLVQPYPGADPGVVRTDILLVAGGQGFGLPDPYWDELNGMGFVQRLSLADPLFGSVARGADIQVWVGGRPVAVHPAAGFTEALSAIAAQCAARWQAPAPAAHPMTTEMLSQATVAIVAGCGSNADQQPGYAQTGDVDGDGIADLVIDWAAIRCLVGPPMPFCGAANCSVQVYLSTRPDRRPFADFLAVGVRLEPGPDGRTRLLTGTTAGSCPETTRPAQCQNVIVWTGSDLQRLPPGGG